GRSASVLDLALLDPEAGGLRRLHGYAEERGSFGVPVAGGADLDGDGYPDVALSAMRAGPGGVEGAGRVSVWFGDGTVSGVADAFDDPDVLSIEGVEPQETAGSEIWMGDVTGDGLGDLLIARQNAGPNGVVGAGSVSIVAGDPGLRDLDALVLSPDAPGVLTLAGDQVYGRVGIWVRAGDATGDGVDDLLIGADQEDGHRGAVWLVEGGPWLTSPGTVVLGAPGPLEGHALRIEGPALDEAHFGGTVNLGDIDGNGKADLFVGATLNRAGADLEPAADGGETHGSGGVPHGRVYVIPDAAFGPPPWSAGWSVESPPAPLTTLTGANLDNNFGEELVGGYDWDADGEADLFVGDLTGDRSGEQRAFSGCGVVVWSIARHAGRSLSLEDPPADLETTLILGADGRDIFSDTAGAGDIDGDGIDDLMSTSPDAEPGEREGAGTATVLFGGPRWPARIDLKDGRLPGDPALRVLSVWGALGTTSSHDYGDMLAYSGAVADIDGDGRADLVVNEMLGNGLQPLTEDVGNLVVISGAVAAAR
ncbi:MAG: FG-GAP repeat protein, partial [Myxococcota bacterium]